MDHISGEGAIETFAKAQALQRQGRDIIHLEIGEPDFDTPAHIVEAGIESMRQGDTHYTPAPGIRELREAIARQVSRTRDIPVAPENVIVTPGAKPIVFFALLALIEPGEEVILPDPGFPAYWSVADFVGGKVVPLPLREENEFRVDIDDLRAAVSPRTKMIFVNSPQNPTGSVLEKSDLEAIAEIAIENDLWVLTDEIYRHLQYDGEFHSIIALPGMFERTILLDGFSKSYAMTGWRLGYGVMPTDAAERITRVVINSHSCVTTFVQRAGVVALEGPQDQVEAMVARFSARRELIVRGLNAIPGWTCVKPRGAFYAFPKIQATGLNSQAMADYLLERAGVAVLPGTAFGANGEGYLRLSYANSESNLQKALERIHDAVIHRNKV